MTPSKASVCSTWSGGDGPALPRAPLDQGWQATLARPSFLGISFALAFSHILTCC